MAALITALRVDMVAIYNNLDRLFNKNHRLFPACLFTDTVK